MIKITFNRPLGFYEQGMMFETFFECKFILTNKINRSKNYFWFSDLSGMYPITNIKSIEKVKPTDL